MSGAIDLVRYRNDGDDFHVLWTARRALRLLDSSSRLVAVAVEGVSEAERVGGPVESGLLVVDTAEYYGSECVADADEVVYLQLKYSTVRPDAGWTVSGLKKTVVGFAQRYRALCTEYGERTVKSTVRFRFVSNRPISTPVRKAFAAACEGVPIGRLEKRTRAALESLRTASGMGVAEFRRFAGQVDFLGGEPSRDRLQHLLGADIGKITVCMDADSVLRMKNLVREKALSKSADDKAIRLDTLLIQFDLAGVQELLPAESKLEKLDTTIGRHQESAIVEMVLGAEMPIVIGAPGGAGKTVLAQRLVGRLPSGSEAVVFDGFAGGDYRTTRLHRHQHSRGLVQIANELAARGLCDVLIPQREASEREYLQAFRGRLKQAAAAVRSRSARAVVLVVLDAADNLGIAAQEANEHSFVPDLLQESPPEACRIVALARTHRVEQYVKPPSQALRVKLEQFDLTESSKLLRRRYPTASDVDCAAFHRLTDGNPRVQANALAVASDLPSLIAALGPTIETIEELIADQFDTALAKVKKEQASSDEIDSLCTALGALSPPVPVEVLAGIARVPADAIHSFVSDFAGGRPILIKDSTLQFRDEPVETWFRERFPAAAEKYGRMADLLSSMESKDAYVASEVPGLLHRAGRHDDLMELALRGPEPDVEDPVEKRSVMRQRIQYALKAALARNSLGDAAKLLLRAGEESAANERQSAFLLDNHDLVSLLGSGVVSDFVFRKRAWRGSPKGYIHCAAMLARDPGNDVEARRFLSLAHSWLKSWLIEQRLKAADRESQDRVDITSDDIAAFAEAILGLDGVDAVLRFMSGWRDWAAFEATQKLASWLLDRGDSGTIARILTASSSAAVRLAVALEMSRVCTVPSLRQTRATVALLSAGETSVKLEEFPDDSEVNLAIVALAEAALSLGVARRAVRRLLEAYPLTSNRVYEWFDPASKREAHLRRAALCAMLDKRDLNLSDVAPDSLRDAADSKDASTNSEVRRLREVYGPVIPWYAARAHAIGRSSGDALSLVLERARKQSRSGASWGSENSHRKAVNEIGRLWLDTLIWSKTASDATIREVERWLADQRVGIFIPTWATLARCSAHHGEGHDAALTFAARARALIESNPENAREMADSYAALARAVLLVSKDEASEHFDIALQCLGRLGDELRERLDSLLALSRRAASPERPSPKEAYRLARTGELFHDYEGGDFPWDAVAETVTALDPSMGLAVISRWNDRDKAALSTTLPAVALGLLKRELLDSRVIGALHAFGGFWNLKEHAPLLLERESEGRQRQALLDTLAGDMEFDPRNQDGAGDVLLGLAGQYGLDAARLPELAANSIGTAASSGGASTPSWAANLSPPELVDWEALLAGLELTSADGIDEAVSRWRDSRAIVGRNDFSAKMRAAVQPLEWPAHTRALADSRELGIGGILDALEGCRRDWSASLAVEAALVDAVDALTTQRSLEVVNRGWGLENAVDRCAALSKASSTEVLARLLLGLASRIEQVPAPGLFALSAALAGVCLSADQALNALRYGLDRVETILRDDDGDGPWREELAPSGGTLEAIAGLLYAALASPDSAVRWRAVHAVRRLCRGGGVEIVTALTRNLSRELPSAFADSGLPFYALHARLYLLIALARSAQEAPGIVAAHIETLVDLALSGLPHVLIRHFAAAAALEVEERIPRTLDGPTRDRLKAVNRSQRTSVEREYGSRGDAGSASYKSRFYFDYDFDRYWLGELADVFNLAHEQVVQRADDWVVDRWCQPDMSAWDMDPRAKRGLYTESTYATHGEYPRVDRYSFYLGYHAMFCVAGELLGEFPPTIEYGEDSWQNWLKRHSLTRPDGGWLADRRDFQPPDTATRRPEPDDWENRGVWRHSVRAGDLDQALGIRLGTATAHVTAWGWWLSRVGEYEQTVRVSSALVSPHTSLALLRALQTASNPHDYRIPWEGDELEIRRPGYRLTGWIEERDLESGLDRFDPLAGGIRWPGPHPGQRIVRLMNLTSDREQRCWSSAGSVAMVSQVWGDGARDADEASNTGSRLVVHTGFLRRVLGRTGRDAIIEVDIGRRRQRQEGDELEFSQRGYTRIYVIRRDGLIHTLRGCHRLWEQAH